ncbi:MAG: capsular biosynthesis protein [Novosphingobium sp.]
MTEHRKFPPVPDDGEIAPSGSLIERAVKSFDLTSFAPPPVPDQLADAPPLQKSRRIKTLQVIQTEMAAAPMPAGETALSEIVSKSAPSAELATFPAREMRRKQIEFKGDHHPIDRKHLRDQGLIVPDGSVTGLLEEFRIVKRHVLLQATELRANPAIASLAQRVLICSPLPGEGKTYCAVNLALSIATEKEGDVLLVDADFAKPSVLSRLGLPGGPGLMDALADPSIDVEDLVIGTDIPGLWVLPAGNATNSDSEYLNSSRTAVVLDRLTDGAPGRMVIFDSPPALAASPAAELAKFVGQALLIARADSTSEGSLKDAISLLSACANIQLLLNAASFSPSGRRFGTYYGYKG